MSIKRLALNRRSSSIYEAAVAFDAEAAEAAVKDVEAQYANNRDDPRVLVFAFGRTAEELHAEDLRKRWKDIVTDGFLKLYSREELIKLLELLGRQKPVLGHGPQLELCDGLSLSPEELARRWNETHPGEAPLG